MTNNLSHSTSTDLRIERPLPSDVKMEEGVVGAILLEKPAFIKVRDLLTAKDFYDPKCQTIFKACISLFNRNEPIDLLTVTSELRKTNKLEAAGGNYGITQLTSSINSAEHIEAHAAIIKELSIRRHLIRSTQLATADAFDETQDAFVLLDKYQQELNEISKFQGAAKTLPLADHLHEKIQEIEAVQQGKKSVGGMPTGFLNLDAVIGAWVPTNLIILAARPGMGKSALALRLCVNQANVFQVPAALFSLEMSNAELVNRLISMETHIYLRNIRFDKLEPHQASQIYDQAGKIADYPLWLIDDCFTLQQIRSKARRLVDEQEVRFIVIDYIQLIIAGQIENRKNSSRENEVAYISRELKMLAKELNVPIIALSQLSRALEHRGGDKRPKLSDLRESGAIEQDADVVLFIYRPEYYGVQQDEKGDALTPGYSEVIVAKNRNGALDMAELIFHGYRTDFTAHDPQSYESKKEHAF